MLLMSVKDNILELLNDNQWELFENDVNLLKNVVMGGNNILHVACMRGKIDFVIKMLEKYPELVYISNGDGDTCAHILLKSGFVEESKRVIERYPNIMYLVNNNGNMLINLAVDQPVVLGWLIDQLPDEQKKMLNTMNNEGLTLLMQLIRLSKSKNIYNDMLTKLVNKGVNVDYPSSYPPLLFAVDHNNLSAVKLLLENGANPNKYDDDYRTPLMSAVKNNNVRISKLLLENKANANYGGYENSFLPVNLSIVNKNKKMFELLLKHGASMNKPDKFKNTPMHFLIKSNKTHQAKWLNDQNIFKAAYYSDLNYKNISGVSPLDLVDKSSIKNNLSELLDYFKNGNKANNTGEEQSEFYVNITGFCKNRKICRKYDNFRSQINIPDGQTQNYGQFNSDTIHNCIYTICLLKKYNNLMLPFQTFIKDKYINDMTNLLNLNQFKTRAGNLIWEIVGLFHELFFELVPHVVIFSDKNTYFVHSSFAFYFNQIMEMSKTRFIMVKLTILPTATSSHANVIIYDKKTNELIRFEPYGPIDAEEYKFLDEFIVDLFEQTLNKKINYLPPHKTMIEHGFQGVSSDSDDSYKKLGDPIGYCLAWIFWFMELRMGNPDKNVIDLLRESYNEIINKKNSSNPFLEHIRNYSSKLNDMKNQFLRDAGVSNENIYSISFSEKDLDKISKKISDSIVNIYESRK